MRVGVAYMTWGENAVRQAKESIESLRRYEPNIEVLVLGDEGARKAFLEEDKIIFQLIEVDPFNHYDRKGFKFHAGRVKPIITEYSPFDRTLYVDADSQFITSPAEGFELLDRWDFIIAESQTRDLINGNGHSEELAFTAEMLGTPHHLYHNSGMIFWKKNERTDELFRLWTEEWLRFPHWDEQVALLRALFRSEALFLTVPYIWNTRNRRESHLLYHWFGSAHARIEMVRGRGRGFHEDSPPAKPLIPFEVFPRVWVRIHDGDQEKVRKIYAERHAQRLGILAQQQDDILQDSSRESEEV